MLRAVLFDADGVLQRNPPGWLDHLHAMVAPGRGRQFAEDVFETEKPAMRGRRDFRGALAEVTRRWGVDTRLDELLDHWHRIEVNAPVVEIVGELRASGVRCCLASNQHAHRAAYMREDLGYDDVFDKQFYSCDMGALKSSPAFFTGVLESLVLPADQVLLVDDSETYVDVARELGLATELWCAADGTPGLRRRLAERGLPL